MAKGMNTQAFLDSFEQGGYQTMQEIQALNLPTETLLMYGSFNQFRVVTSQEYSDLLAASNYKPQAETLLNRIRTLNNWKYSSETWKKHEPTPEPTGSALITPESERHEENNTQKPSSAWQYLPFDGYYQAETQDGRIVRCNRDNFDEIAAECKEAGIELTPERALEEGWPGFYVLKQHGGARPGAGRKPDSAKAHTREPLYQEGYNAGYQAGLRKQLTLQEQVDHWMAPDFPPQNWARCPMCHGAIEAGQMTCAACQADAIRGDYDAIRRRKATNPA